MQIGDKVWIFDSNKRVYEDDKGNKLDNCWYRGHFREKYIIGETKQSWIIGYEGNDIDSRTNFKVNKKTLTYSITNNFGLDKKLYISEEEIKRKCWVYENRSGIIRKIEQCTDYDKLRKIEDILLSE